MQLEWMGRYREVIRSIMRHGNLYARTYTDQLADGSGIMLSSLEWQAFESILEFEEENYNMSVLAKKTGIPQSNFSKYVKTMVEKGLVERFQKDGNRKDIVLKGTASGHHFYQLRSSLIAAEWQEAFDMLEACPDEQLASFAHFIEQLTKSFDPTTEKIIKLVKVKDKAASPEKKEGP